MSRLRAEDWGADRNPLCGTDWGRLLKDEFADGYWKELTAFVQKERASFPDSVYPPDNEVFRALELTWCEDTKVVIVEQDPYHGPGQAHGLCFSVPCGVRRPQSLVSAHDVFLGVGSGRNHPGRSPWIVTIEAHGRSPPLSAPAGPPPVPR
jgi:hypothetical protein